MPTMEGALMERGESDEVVAALAFLRDAGLTPEQAAAGLDAVVELAQGAVMALGRAAQIVADAFQGLEGAAASLARAFPDVVELEAAGLVRFSPPVEVAGRWVQYWDVASGEVGDEDA